MHRMKCFEDGYIEYNSHLMVIVLEDHHYASNDIYSIQGGIIWDDLFKIENKNRAIMELIDQIQKKYNECNGLNVQ